MNPGRQDDSNYLSSDQPSFMTHITSNSDHCYIPDSSITYETRRSKSDQKHEKYIIIYFHMNNYHLSMISHN